FLYRSVYVRPPAISPLIPYRNTSEYFKKKFLFLTRKNLPRAAVMKRERGKGFDPPYPMLEIARRDEPPHVFGQLATECSFEPQYVQ
ncbi:hypothetical protein, partial [Salmonella enterica]|uniref:hypothetical protein n=1 Tax=Salmonella enterica TaxID=28901 RepID=UPI001ADDAD6C